MATITAREDAIANVRVRSLDDYLFRSARRDCERLIHVGSRIEGWDLEVRKATDQNGD